MMGFERSDDYQPLFWVNGRPVHVITLLVAVHTASLVVCCLVSWLSGVPYQNLLDLAGFSSAAVLSQHQWWQPLTYNFVQFPTFWFLLNMAFFFFWGREVERYFGRRTFAALYGGLMLATPVFLLTRGALTHADQSLVGWGSTFVHLGMFVVFATIYPNVQVFFGIPCKWYAWGILALATLQGMAVGGSNMLAVLWLSVAVAFLGTRYVSMGSDAFALPEGWGFREKFPRGKAAPVGVKPRLKPRRAVDTDGGGSDDYRGRDVHESIDPLLDKISKHGLASLTHSERAVLEKARVSLLRKDKGD